MRHLVVAALVCAWLAPAAAWANGRPPSVQSIHFRPGNPQHVIAGATFGLLTSDDGGGTWRWICESAVGYGGTFDPDYAYAASGAVLATTLAGARVERDGCTFEATGLGSANASAIEVAAPDTVFAATTNDGMLHTSDDDGVTFPTSTMPGAAGDWWQSVVVAPSSPQRVYLSGYHIEDGMRVPLAFTSDDGGASFTPMTTTGMQVSQSSIISIAGVHPTTPTTVYAIVTFENGTTTDGVYVSTNAGDSWTRINGGMQPISFLVRGNGQLVIAGPTLAQMSTTGGASWTDLVSPPPITCLAERADGVVWACTFTFGGERIMTSPDLVNWTGVLRFANIAGPVSCPAGTVQHDTCEAMQWCFLRIQLGIVPDPTGCDPQPDGAVDLLDASTPTDAFMVRPPSDPGCCDTRRDPRGALLLALVVVIGLGRRRRVRA